MSRRPALISLILIAGLIASSCAPRPKAVEAPVAALPREEQEKLAMAKFTEMLEMTANVHRTSVLQEIEDGYYTIINSYPDTDLAEESYWRLIIMNLEDYYPVREQKAEDLYREYFRKYPKPTLNNAINDTMVRYYYRTKNWDKLAAFSIPYLREYVKSGYLPTPLYVFFYSEAMFNLGDFKEAEKGYRIVLDRFPESTESKLSMGRLESIKKHESVPTK